MKFIIEENLAVMSSDPKINLFHVNFQILVKSMVPDNYIHHDGTLIYSKTVAFKVDFRMTPQIAWVAVGPSNTSIKIQIHCKRPAAPANFLVAGQLRLGC